ncbi:TPA: hypothetical protein H1008_02810 [archaeon]|nr:hypothetical protein [Candidatus Undinarchaeales archaeon SRR5007147.bin71]
MGLLDKFKKKKEDLVDDELMKDLGVPDLPPAPKPPKPSQTIAPKPRAAPKPAPKIPAKLPAPVSKTSPRKPAQLSEKQVAKLPLFMKVENYQKVVGELKTLVDSLNNIGTTLNEMSKLEHEHEEALGRWRQQLDITKDQVHKLLSDMPETGRLKALVSAKTKTKSQEKIKKELSDLKKGMSEAEKKDSTIVQKEIKDMRSGITSLHDEMNRLHLELKTLNNLTQLSSAQVVGGIKEKSKTSKPANIPLPSSKKPILKKSKAKAF